MKNIVKSFSLAILLPLLSAAMDPSLRKPLIKGLAINSPYAACYADRGKKLIIGSHEGTLVYDAENCSSPKQVIESDKCRITLAANSNTPEVAMSGINEPLDLCDLESAKHTTLIEKIDDRLCALQYDQEGKLLLVSTNESCDIWDCKNKQIAQRILWRRGAVRAQFNPENQNELALVTHRGYDDALMFWDVRMHKPLRLVQPEEPIHAINYTKDGTQLVGSANWQFSVHDTKTAAILAYYDYFGKKLKEVKPYVYRTDRVSPRAAHCLAFLPSEKNTFVAGLNENLIFCDLDNDSNHARIMAGEYADDYINSVAAHPDGKTLAVVSAFGQGSIHGHTNSVKIVDVQALKEKSGKWKKFEYLS